MAVSGRVAVVTGAGSGIGRAVSLALHSAGWKVSLAGRRAEALDQTIELGAERDRFIAVPTDVTNPDLVTDLFVRTREVFGRLDLLFNNAGVAALGVPLERMSLRQWQAVVNVNLTGCFLCAQQAIRLMKMQEPMGGRIINNGSVSAHSPRPNSAAYTATKHAVTGLTKSISLDGRAFNIACGQIDVGNVETPFAAGMAGGMRQADGFLSPEAVISLQDVAQAVLYMANLPLEANVQFMTIVPTKMPYVGRG